MTCTAKLRRKKIKKGGRMEVKVNALVIRAIDYKDNDKILTLYSLEKGKITAGIKGVKKAKAKLKFCSEPFCFAEYILAEKNGRYTVISASYIDSFYDLRLSLQKYYLSAVISEFLCSATESDVADPYLFDLAINSIKEICYQPSETGALAKFLYGAVDCLGYGLQSSFCNGCGEEITGRVFFRYKDAIFSCEGCKEEDFFEIRLETYKALLALENGNLAGLAEMQEGAKMLVYFLAHYLYIKTEVKLKSVEALKNL